MHDLLRGETSSVNAMEYEEEEDDKEGLAKTVAREYEHERNNRWRIPDNSWLELEEVDVCNVNVVIDEDESCGPCDQ